MKRILITNDDGINALGIRKLAEALSELGEIFIVAPDVQKSACGHGITMHIPMTVEEKDVPFAKQAWAVGGTPADCVKLGVKELARDIDLVVSGTNMGSNVGNDCFYSGTVSGAAEGLFSGCQAVAFSICSTNPKNYGPSMKYAKKVVKMILDRGLEEGIMLNINIPDIPDEEIQGVRVTTLGQVKYDEGFGNDITNLGGRFYWYTGKAIKLPQKPDSDIQAIRDNCISVTPLQFDITAFDKIDEFKKWELDY